MGQERAQQPFLVTHHGRLYDIGPFLSRHPGGIAHLEPYRGRSVTALLRGGGHGGGAGEDAASTLIHSEAARYILKEYRLPQQDKDEKTLNGLNGHSNRLNGLNGHSKKNGLLTNGTNGINGKHNSPTAEELDDDDDDFEDLEALVDWDKPMLGQVASLGPKYTRWVNFPVDRKLRLFGPSWLEELSKARWYYIPIVWIPVMFMFLSLHFNGGHSQSMAAVGVVLGVINWSLLEYSLHRWFFHLPPGDSGPLITMHFLIHGLHHKVPFDNMRLVFPPSASAILGVIIYSVYALVMPAYLLNCLAAGVTIGYITYDLFHYYLHFGTPKPPSHMYYMKRYHNQHHFSHHDAGYGITSSFWDKIFGTKIILQRLAKTIKW